MGYSKDIVETNFGKVGNIACWKRIFNETM